MRVLVNVLIQVHFLLLSLAKDDEEDADEGDEYLGHDVPSQFRVFEEKTASKDSQDWPSVHKDGNCGDFKLLELILDDEGDNCNIGDSNYENNLVNH